MAGTLLGFDFGEKRIGVAVGETATHIAHPLAGIAEEATDARFAAIEKLVSEWKPAGFVVGRPRHADGAEHEIALLAEKFARRLSGRFALPVEFVDETLTSAQAERELRDMHARLRGAADVDALAAALILQSYLDSLIEPRQSGDTP
jgi:putative Holliday junction resolvase